MSRAFTKESDDQWLSDVAPTVSSLLVYLTRENNDIRVSEIRRFFDGSGREVHVMTNGLSYVKDHENKWQVAEE